MNTSDMIYIQLCSSSRRYYPCLSPLIESCIWINFISVAYTSWYHWICGRTQHKAVTINQLACPSYSLYVQLLWYPMYYPRGMKARVSFVQWLKPYSILATTLDSNPGDQIQQIISADHYTTTSLGLELAICFITSTCRFLQALWQTVEG